ncbi:MAG TPA: tetratricopeptide repeat protein [Pseudonocardiaceae bacterium]|nr:tetratricopeptide repeat protein [Pseudonocardiaceae bacterium]
MHRTVLVVDVAGFGDPRRTNPDRLTVRQGLYTLLRQALERSGVVWADCEHEDRGDGVLITLPATVTKSRLVESLPGELVAALRAHNHARNIEEQIRLRMAVHAGEIHYDEHGVVGQSVDLTFRLLDAPVLKDALARSSGLLAVIASHWFFDEVIKQSKAAAPHRYQEVRVRVKELDTIAWICLPDSDTTASAAPHLTRGGSTPHQLPTTIRQFVGRARELDQLTAQLDLAARSDTVVITAIDGSAGIGKSTLALHWAHQVKHRFPDGQLHVNLRGFDHRQQVDADQALHGFLQALGVDANAIPVDLDAKSALYRSLLAQRRMLVVLDNARSSDHVRPLLPATEHCVVLITSRSRLDGLAVREGAFRLALDVPPADEATDLLAERIHDARLTEAPAATEELIALCARLPLALSLVAGRAAGQPALSIAELVGQLRDERSRLDFLDLGEADLSLRAVFSWSARELSAPAARLFRLLGVHPGPDIDLPACGALADTEATARELLRELTGAHLITEHRPGRYRFHDLLRAYAAEQAWREEYAGERAEAIERFLDHYLHQAMRADHVIQPCRDSIVRRLHPITDVGPADEAGYRAAIDWFRTESATLLAVIRFAADNGHPAYAWPLAWACTTYLRRTGRRQARVAVHRTALRAVRAAGDRIGLATELRHLGSALARVEAFDEALASLAEALKIYAELSNEAGTIITHLAYARLYDALHDPENALRHARIAWQIVREDEADHLSRADALTAMAEHLTQLGRGAEALPLGERALAYYEGLDHLEGQADALANLGEIERQLGRVAPAVDHYERSLAIDRRLGDRYWEAHALERLGDVHITAGDRARAGYAWQDSAAILADLGHPDQFVVLTKLSGLGDQPTGFSR